MQEREWCILGQNCVSQFSNGKESWLMLGRAHGLSLDFIPQAVGYQYCYRNLGKITLEVPLKMFKVIARGIILWRLYRKVFKVSNIYISW